MKKRMITKQSKQKGFTLIELMVVIAIIGILATIAIPIMTKVITKAKITQITGDYETLKTAATFYYLEYDNVKGIVTGDSGLHGNTEARKELEKYVDNLPTMSPFNSIYHFKLNKE